MSATTLTVIAAFAVLAAFLGWVLVTVLGLWGLAVSVPFAVVGGSALGLYREKADRRR